MFNVSQNNIRKVTVPLPPKEEQRRIVEVAETLRERVAFEVAMLAGLRTVKIAASDALLRGRIRVARSPGAASG